MVFNLVPSRLVWPNLIAHRQDTDTSIGFI
jgi:hypothetical protein